MKCVIQRVTSSSVVVDNELINKIENGLMVLVGFCENDSSKEIDYCIKKIINLRIFDDENGVMNKSVLDINGSILLISQFTLYANPYEGNRPSYKDALNSKLASPLYDEMVSKMNNFIKTYPGKFGADMKVSLLNDGPVTIIIDTNEKGK